MILDELAYILFDTLIRGTGNLVLGVFGRDLRTKGAADDLIVNVAGIGFWVVLGALVFFLVKWIV